jgi:hypothetical protein
MTDICVRADCSFLMAQCILASDPAIEIIGADEQWTTEIGDIPSDAVDSSDANFNLPNEAVVCHADEVWNYEFGTPDAGLVDSSDAEFALPDEVVVCHADEVWTGGMESVEIGNDEVNPAKTTGAVRAGIVGNGN